MKFQVENLWLSEPCARRQGTFGTSCRGCSGRREAEYTVLVCKCGCHGRERVEPAPGFFSSIGRQIKRAFQN